MPTISEKEVIEKLLTLSPTKLLDPNTANDLYNVVPTPASKYLGLNLMTTRQSHTPYVKYTAREPQKDLMKSVKFGTKSPVSNKRGYATQKHIVVKFKDSLIFDEEELFLIEQAKRTDARDAEIREAAEAIVLNIEGLKEKNYTTQEKLFWEGLLGQMNVIQINSGVESDIEISTNTRALPALTSTDTWDYHMKNDSGSTADPVIDLKEMIKTFTGKGGTLGHVYMNLKTY